MLSPVESRYIAIKRALFDKVYGNLNEMQRKAVFTTEGPLLVLAGAGSGKTTVLVHRIAFIIRYGNAYFSEKVPENITEERVAELEKAVELSPEEIRDGILPEFIENPCPPYRMLAITFTNKAANEMKIRLADRLQDETLAQDVWSGTFHAMCMRILRRDGHRIGYGSSFSIYDMDDQKKVVTAVMKHLGIDEKQFPVKNVMNAIGREKDKLHTPEDTADLAGSDFRGAKIAEIYREYADVLKRSNAMDFDDIIMQTVRLLRECDDLREYYQKKFHYVCIDEYQDTNTAQFELAALLSGRYCNLMVVGDDDQSIYKFRGATIENILGFDTRFKNATVIKLEQNYRSTSTILEAANKVIAHNEGRKGKNLWTMGDKGDRIVVRQVEDPISESRSIVDTINRTISESRKKGSEKEYSYRDFAVLYRTNSQSSSVESAFKKSSIPYRMVGGTRFNDRKEIRDAVAYMSIISNCPDQERLFRIINEPRRGIGERTLEVVREISIEQNCSVFDVMAHADSYPALGRSVSKLQTFTDCIRSLSEFAQTANMADLFDAIMSKTGYMRMLLESDERDSERIENLNQLKSNMMEYEQNNENPTLIGFLEDNALLTEVDKYDNTADAVVLMTVHSSKGLEFPIVFLPGMEDGIFPSMQTVMEGPEQLEEERRLAYVALTRAKKQIYIIHAKSRIWYAQTVFNPLSRFVKEIPSELVEEEDLTGENSPVSKPNPVISKEERIKQRINQHADVLTVGQTAHIVSGSTMETVKSLQPGDRVVHITFGQGLILSAKPMGSDVLFEVMFDTVGTKKLMGTYAKLKKL